MYLTRSPSFSKNPRSAATRNGSAVQFEPLVQPTFNTLGSAAFVAVTDAMARTIENRNRNKRPIEFIAFSLDSAAPLRLFLGASFLIPADARVSTKNPCFESGLALDPKLQTPPVTCRVLFFTTILGTQ